MQISFNLDTKNRQDIELAHATIGYMLGFLPTAECAPNAPLPASATPMAQPTENELTANPTQTEKIRRARAAKKEAKEAALAAPDPVDPALDFAAVKAKLQSYSDDARFGMNGVLDILNKYGVQRVSALPEAQYKAFVAEIDGALANRPDPLA